MLALGQITLEEVAFVVWKVPDPVDRTVIADSEPWKHVQNGCTAGTKARVIESR